MWNWKKIGAGRASVELENSTCADGTTENERTQSGREFSASEKKIGAGSTSAELE